MEKDNISNYLGQRIRQARKNKSLTAEKLASLLDISNGYMRQVESGAKRPSTTLLIRIQQILDCGFDYLFQDFLSPQKSYTKNALVLDFEEKLNQLSSARIDEIHAVLDAMFAYSIEDKSK